MENRRKRLLMNRTDKRMLAGLFACMLIITCWVMFVPNRIGASDNGDYYRMNARVGVSGTQTHTTDEYPYFYAFYDEWDWLPFDWAYLSPTTGQPSNTYLVQPIRGLMNLFGDTMTDPIKTQYLSYGYLFLLAAAFFLMLRSAILAMKVHAVWLSALAFAVLLGSMNLCWLNSFYGEAMIFVAQLLALGVMSAAVISPRGGGLGKTMSVLSLLATLLLVTAKAQMVATFPIWAALSLVLVGFHWLGSKAVNKLKGALVMAVAVVFMGAVGVGCVNFYQYNSSWTEEANVYSSLFNGMLLLTDEPEEVLEDLGFDPALASNVGFSPWDTGDHIFATDPEQWKATAASFGTFDILKYYLTHPVLLYRAMDYTAGQARAPENVMMLERAEQYDVTLYHQINKLGVWANIRKFFTPAHFWGYIVIYVSLLTAVIVSFARSKKKPRKRLLLSLFAALILAGIFEYPLPYIGFGSGDVHKELYPFMLSYDLTLLIATGWVFYTIRKELRRRRKLNGM